MINTSLPIILNVVLVMIVIAGILVGRKNGWKLELGKFIFICLSGVASYFLTPLTTEFITNLSKISETITTLNLIDFTLNSTCFALLFLAFYLVISIVCLIIRKNVDKIKTNKMPRGAKPYKIVTQDKKANKKLQKQQKKLAKIKAKQQHKKHNKSAVFGAIIGILTAIMIGLVLICPVKDVLVSISKTDTELTEITKGYEYTIYGQFDKYVYDVTDFIVNK